MQRSSRRQLAHPLWLVERWVRQFGLDRARQICTYDQHAPAAAVRLADAGTEAELKTRWHRACSRPVAGVRARVQAGNVSGARAFAEGRVAIQDEASQLVALLVGKGSRILDCCAAPGGKTRVLAERNPEAGIVALELHPHRARLLRKLVPARNVEVISSDVLEFNASAGFDRVLADVPCSGTGTLAHNPEIKWRLKPEDLADLHRRQVAILRAAMQQVAPGGRLVYSTCSLEPEENEEVVEKALSGQSAFRRARLPAELERLRAEGELVWNDIDSLISGRFVRTIPGVHPCDGFFVAILQKSMRLIATEAGRIARRTARRSARRYRFTTELRSSRRCPQTPFLPPRDSATQSCWPGNGAIGEEPSGAGSRGHASDAQSSVLHSLSGGTEWLSDEAGHDQGLRLRWRGDQQTYFRSRDAAGVRRRSLGHDFAVRGIRRLHLGDGANVQTAAADVDIGGTLALSDHIGNGHALRSQALGHADLPAPPHLASGGWELRQDFSFRNGGAVVLAFDVQFQAVLLCDHAGCRGTFPYQVGYGDFVAMDGQAHGGERGNQGHHQQEQRQQDKPEKRLHQRDYSCS